MSKNTKLSIQIMVYVTWIATSFYVVYYLISGEFYISSWRFASTAFTWYLLTIFPLSLIFAFLLVRKHINDILQRVKILIPLAGILLIIGFTSIEWTVLTTNYGNIESYKFKDPIYIGLSVEQANKLSVFEREQLFHEMVVDNYNIVFKKIWTFIFIIFILNFLLFKAVTKKFV